MIKDFKCFFITLTLLFSTLASAQILTVNGEISDDEMGISLIHEHIMVDWIGADSTGYHRWNRREVVQRVLPFLEDLKKHGVTTLVDCTPAYLGRDPYILKELSHLSGIQILTNTGYYGVHDNKYIPLELQKASAQKMASHWTEEFKRGIDGSGIKPGFIKISVNNSGTLSEVHEKLITAAGLTHLATGMTIVSHTGGDEAAMAQIEVLKNMGVSPRSFVWAHAQNGTIDGYIEAAKYGAWISLDHVNAGDLNNPEKNGNIDWYVATLTKLKDKNILQQVLVSHDAGWYTVGETNGGDFRGYTNLFTELIPALKKHGFSQKDIDMLLVENPKEAYMLRIKKVQN
ncbi:phosphotriesterase [Pseudozobellia sp. WGM2]|uniref:phosphotriesterase family protein n=1 Tax=Pseudozobellia sp. WGM2 TaxID=2787625 RepID=UPI001AE065D5|nr:phosphotriesterase [Pseudozobellia sp. WGM2]